MTQLRNLFLVADDERPHSHAFERTRAMALAAGARVHLGAFCYSRAIAAVGIVNHHAMQEARDGYVANARSSIDQAAQSLRELGIPTTSSVVWAHPALPEVLQQVDEQKSDLLIKDVRRDPLLKRIVATSLDQQLIRAGKLPVMLVVEDDRPRPRRILVAADVSEGGSELNAMLMRYAVGLSLQADADLHLAYVSEPLATISGDALVDSSAYTAMQGKIYESRKRAFSQFADSEQVAKDRQHFLEGDAALTLCSFAAAHAFDVIVVATANRSGLERFLIGSTAEQIIRHAPCSLVTVPAAMAG